MAIALTDLAGVSTDAERVRLLSESIAAYRRAQEVWTRSDFPQHWGNTQYNLAIALGLLAHATEEKSESLRLRKEAVARAEDALRLYPEKHFPTQYVQTQDLLTGLRLFLKEAEKKK